MKSKKLFHITLFFTYGVSLKKWAEDGILSREIILYKKLIEKGIEVTFFTYGDRSDFEFGEKLQGITVLPAYTIIKKPKIKLFGFIQSFILPLYFGKYSKNVNLYKTNQMWGAWAPLLAKFLYRKPLLLRCGYEAYRNDVRRGASFLHRTFLFLVSLMTYHIADKVHISSNTDAAYIKRKFFVNTSKIIVFPNFIDTDNFRPRNNHKYKKKNRLLFVGRLSYQKNLFNLLEAFEGVSYGLDIIGDGDLKSSLEEYVSCHDVDINFLGKFPNETLSKVIIDYPVFILPSLYENNPKSLLEAMACGCAVIGTRVEGIKDIIRHMGNGYLCDKDAESIRQAIQVVIEDESLRSKIGKQARLDVIKYNSLDRIVEKEISAYKSLFKY